MSISSPSTSSQYEAIQATQSQGPIGLSTTNELISRIQPLIQKWQQNQNRQEVVQQMDTILTPLTQEQRAIINQSLAQTQGAAATINEINHMRTLQSRLNTAITEYDKFWTDRRSDDVSNESHMSKMTHMINTIQELFQSATFERMEELPSSFLEKLRESFLYKSILDPLHKLEIAYKDKNININDIVLKRTDLYQFAHFSRDRAGNKIIIYNLIETFISQRIATDEKFALGVQYYNAMKDRWLDYDALNANRHALSAEECKCLISIQEYHVEHHSGITPCLFPNCHSTSLYEFLKIRIALENRELREDTCWQIIPYYKRLPEIDKKFLENQYSIHQGNFEEFLKVYTLYKNVQMSYDRIICFPQCKEIQLNGIVEDFNNCKVIAQRLGEDYDTLADVVFQYAEPSLRPCINDFNRLLGLKLHKDALQEQLTTYQQIQNPSVEQQNQHLTRCHDLIQRIEAFSIGESVSTAFPIMQEALEDKYSISTKLLKYKGILERLKNASGDAQRIPIIWELAQIEASVSQSDLAIIENQLNILYPGLWRSSRDGIINTYELQYAKLLIQIHKTRGSVVSVDTILALQGIASNLDPNQRDALLQKFRDHLPDFNTHIPNVSEFYPLIRTDMEALRQIHLLRDTSLTLAARAAIVNRFGVIRNNIDPAHLNEIITTLINASSDNQNAKTLLKAIYEANLELACSVLTDENAQVRSQALVAVGEVLGKVGYLGIAIRSEFFEYLRANYAALRDQEIPIQYVQLVYWQKHLLESGGTTPNDRQILLMQGVATHMSADACQTLRDTLNLSQHFPEAVFNTLHPQMQYLCHIQRLHDLPTTPDQAAQRTQCLDAIKASDSYKNMIEQQRSTLATTPEGRELLQNFYAAQLEVQYRDLQRVDVPTGTNLQELDMIVSKGGSITTQEMFRAQILRNNLIIRDCTLMWLAELLRMIQELEMTMRQMNILECRILAPDILATLGQRYPLSIQQEEIECMAYIDFLAASERDRHNASPQELVQINERRREAYTALSRLTSHFNAGCACMLRCLETIEREHPVRRTHNNSIRAVLRSLSTSELHYNANYSLSADHYNRVRLDDTIPALPSTVNADTTFREGLLALFNELPFEELQAYLTDRNVTRDGARDILTTYINNVMNPPQLFGAPNPANTEQARAWWDEIKHTIVHVILHIQSLQPGPEQSETEIRAKKKALLATLMGAATSIGTEHAPCGGRYRAEAVLLYQQIVLGTPVSFVSEVNRQLNILRETNARNLSVTEATDAGMQPHEYIGFLRLVGRELAIPGTELATRSDADIVFTQTRMYQQRNNTAALRQRFEEKYTPFAMISCIAQEVGPQGSQHMRDFFWEWCYAHARVEPSNWGITRSPDDWGGNLEAIQEHDAAKRVLQEIRNRIQINTASEAIDAYLRSQGIERKASETVLQAVLRKYAIPRQRDAVLHEIRRLVQTNTSPEKVDEYLRSQGIERRADEAAAQAVQRHYPTLLSDEEAYASIITSEHALTKSAFLERAVYEELPSRWTSSSSTSKRLKVNYDFVAKMLVQMGLLRSTAPSGE